jgi:pyrroline-5-carboxylate reductase
MQHRNVSFIGAGNMTRSIISGLVKNGYPPSMIMASNPSLEKLTALQADFSIQITQDNQQAAEFADSIVLAVKPQIMADVCSQLAESSELAGKLFVSIAAGIPSQRLQQLLGPSVFIIRTMPNTPSAIGKGMTGLYANSAISAPDKLFAGELLSQVGEIAWVEDEKMIDGVTAAAGSSPAYFFLFLEAMQKEMESQGFDRPTARKLVQQAMLGSAEMVCQNPEVELSTLRTQVTSKGGTTAKAIEHFQHAGIEDIVSGAMQAAIARAKEMANQF